MTFCLASAHKETDSLQEKSVRKKHHSNNGTLPVHGLLQLAMGVDKRALYHEDTFSTFTSDVLCMDVMHVNARGPPRWVPWYPQDQLLKQ